MDMTLIFAYLKNIYHAVGYNRLDLPLVFFDSVDQHLYEFVEDILTAEHRLSLMLTYLIYHPGRSKSDARSSIVLCIINDSWEYV